MHTVTVLSLESIMALSPAWAKRQSFSPREQFPLWYSRHTWKQTKAHQTFSTAPGICTAVLLLRCAAALQIKLDSDVHLTTNWLDMSSAKQCAGSHQFFHSGHFKAPFQVFVKHVVVFAFTKYRISNAFYLLRQTSCFTDNSEPCTSWFHFEEAILHWLSGLSFSPQTPVERHNGNKLSKN